MKIAVLGCGAIGGIFLNRLSQKEKVTGVVKSYQKSFLAQEGLVVEKEGAKSTVKVDTVTSLAEPVDLAIFATKTGDLKPAAAENRQYLEKALVLTTQNGLQAENILKAFFPEENIVSSIVMFGATFFAPNRIVCNFDGSLVIGSLSNSVNKVVKVKEKLEPFFKVETSSNIKGAKYLKLFVNLNNCLPAILGKSMQETFSDLDICKLAINLNREAYRVVKAAGIVLADLPGYPRERIEKLTGLPLPQAAAIFSQVMTGLSRQPLDGSILQSIKRQKPSEIDYINGEIAELAKAINCPAHLNKKVTQLVHKVEENGFLTKKTLLSEVEKENSIV